MNIKEAIDNYTPAAPKLVQYETTAFGYTFKETYTACPKCGLKIDDFCKPNYCERCGKRFQWHGTDAD